jgi:hypothetical protein
VRSQEEAMGADMARHRRDHHSNVAVGTEEVGRVVAAVVADHIGAALARTPNAENQTCLPISAARGAILPWAVVDRAGSDFLRFVRSREGSCNVAARRIRHCQSYCVLPPPLVVRLAVVPTIRLGYRSLKGTSPMVDRSSPAEALHNGNIPEDLLSGLRSLGEEDGAVAVHSSSCQSG